MVFDGAFSIQYELVVVPSSHGIFSALTVNAGIEKYGEAT